MKRGYEGPTPLRLPLPLVLISGSVPKVATILLVGRAIEFCREHRLDLRRQEATRDAVWLHFGSRFDAAKFKMLWLGWSDDGIGHVVSAEDVWGDWRFRDLYLTREAAEQAMQERRSRMRRVEVSLATEDDP